MAKWGEGDPRWIVEERKDATNVNNWHWTERDVSSWSSERLRQLLCAVKVEGSEGTCQVVDVPKLEGEACINNRKGKLFFFYEWQLRAGWLGTSKAGVKFRGNIDVSNLSDENDEDDLDISVSLCKDQPDTSLLDLMKRSGAEEVRRALGKYVVQLKSEFSQGMILPTANKPKPESETSKKQFPTSIYKPTPRCSSSLAPCHTSDGLQTKGFNLKETFQTSVDELYMSFINQEVPYQKIEMKWRFRTWPNEHYATIRLDLEDRGNETELRMECKGVPQGEEETTREGWARFYFRAIKESFGY